MNSTLWEAILNHSEEISLDRLRTHMSANSSFYCFTREETEAAMAVLLEMVREKTEE